jgi:Secretion system C-terminal sorting domain/Papain-like cysteine protease AvrRpt2
MKNTLTLYSMKNIKSLSILIAAVFFAVITVNGQVLTSGIKVVSQTQTNWCWAACSQSVLQLYGTTKSQCEINNFAWSKSNCCTSPGGCNNTNNLSGASGTVDKVLMSLGSLTTQNYNAALTVAQIKTALTDGRPFVIACYWTGGGGHAIVGCAYDVAGGKLTMMDPWQNNGMTTCNFSGGSSNIVVSGSQGSWGGTLVVTSSLTGINEASKLSGIQIYPSPATDLLNISVPTEGTYNVAIYNYLGAVVNQTNIPAGKISSAVDISNLTKGMYFVKVVDAKQSEAVFKVVKD